MNCPMDVECRCCISKRKLFANFLVSISPSTLLLKFKFPGNPTELTSKMIEIKQAKNQPPDSLVKYQLTSNLSTGLVSYTLLKLLTESPHEYTPVPGCRDETLAVIRKLQPGYHFCINKNR